MSFAFCPRRSISVVGLVTLLLMVAFLQHPGSAAPAIAQPADAVVLQPQMFFDPFANRDAFSVLVPKGWKLEGHANWDLTTLSLVQVDLCVFDPATNAQWISYPRPMFYDGVRENYVRMLAPRVGQQKATADAARALPEGGIYGNVVAKGEIRKLPQSPKEYLHDLLVPRMRKDINDAKDVTILSETDLPKFAEAKSAESKRASPAIKSADCQASAIRISYTNAAGVKYEEQFVCVINHMTGAVTPPPFTFWAAEVYSCRAPAGKLDAMLPMFEAINASAVRQPSWFGFQLACNDQVMEFQREQTRRMIEASNQQMQSMRDQAREQSKQTSDRIRQRFAEQQQAKAETHQQFMNYVQNVRQYSVPGSNAPITLPSTYKYHYLGTGGQIISTNDPTFQPPADPQTSWQSLQPTK